MPRVTFVEANGTKHVVDAELDQSLMRAAIDNLVPGIVAECGGFASCATCHAYLDAECLSKFPSPGAAELAMLEGALQRNKRSRLSCQLKVTAEHDGLVVHLPPEQAH
jgi:2Fe-2S ferredoxin